VKQSFTLVTLFVFALATFPMAPCPGAGTGTPDEPSGSAAEEGQGFAAPLEKDILFRFIPGQTDFSTFVAECPEKWRIAGDALIYKSDDWGYATATVNPGEDDYRLDAVVSIAAKSAAASDLINPAFNNGPGVVFRRSGDKAAIFFLSQPCGGWAALARLFPLASSRFSGKEVVYALTKDKEKEEHRLVVLVKGSLANGYVDGELACVLDLSGYDHGAVGLTACFGARFSSFTVSRLAPDVTLATSRKPRPLLADGKIYSAQYDWKRSVQSSLKVLQDAFSAGSPGVSGEEDMAHYTYRCVVWMKEGMSPYYAYPAFHHCLILESLLNALEHTKDDAYLRQARKLADWELAHSTPESDLLPHMPYSTTYNGKMGGNVDGDSIMPDKAGIMGKAYLRLWALTHDDRYKDGAARMADTLLRLQLPEGRWQGRVNNRTGAVTQDYSSNAIFNIAFLDELHRLDGAPRYQEASKKAFQWLMENPVKTYRWTGFYEDVAPGEESIGNWDAIDTARYLLAHRGEHPEYLNTAKDITNWVATSFSVHEDGKWPMVGEQSCCMPVMVGHTMHYAALLMDMHKATGDAYYRDAAASATNAAFDAYHEGKGACDWYSIACTPLYFGLDLAKALGMQ
jgi:hypothetical protein